MIQALLFDYGGTLDTGARHWSYVLHEGFTHAGVNLDKETFREAYVYAERALASHPYIVPSDDFLALLRKKVSLEMDRLEQMGQVGHSTPDVRDEWVEKVAAYCDRYARDHVRRAASVLRELHQRYKLVVVSNFYGNLETILRTYGLSPFFESIVESAVVGVRKPNPAIWTLGVEAAGVDACECAAIGDSFTKDILPAQQAGCETVWFSGEEWETKDYDRSVPTHVITSLPEITRYY